MATVVAIASLGPRPARAEWWETFSEQLNYLLSYPGPLVPTETKRLYAEMRLSNELRRRGLNLVEDSVRLQPSFEAWPTLDWKLVHDSFGFVSKLQVKSAEYESVIFRARVGSGTNYRGNVLLRTLDYTRDLRRSSPTGDPSGDEMEMACMRLSLLLLASHKNLGCFFEQATGRAFVLTFGPVGNGADMGAVDLGLRSLRD